MSRPTPLPNALDALYATILVLGSPLLLYRLARTGKWRTDWRGRFGHLDPLPSTARPTVLLHGVSVGEVAAAEPLVRALTARDAELPVRVVVSATTNTGVERARRLYGAEHPVVRHPFDFSRPVHRFLEAVRPDVVAHMELEVWPNFTRACERRRIPAVVVNGRLSESSFIGYRRARTLVAPSFRRLAGVAAQTEAYADRFRALGVPRERVTVADSMKWDVRPPLELSVQGERLGAEMGVDPERPLVVAVSTGPGEERMLLEGRPERVQLMVVPRRPERFEEVARLGAWIRRSEGTRGVGGDLFLLDTMGEAEAATALADVVAIGRSWNGLGGSNPVTAATLGKPAVVGPEHQHFREMIGVLVSDGAVRIAGSPWTGLKAILEDPALAARMAEAGPRAVSRHRGAVRRNVDLVRAALAGGLPSGAELPQEPPFPR